MIVNSKDDVVQVHGALHKNEWLTIKALAGLLLKQFPQGILIDCSNLTDVSELGARTFLDAMRDIQREGARMIVVNLPENVMKVIRSVPGIRSQLPVATTLEEARASLKLVGLEKTVGADSASGIILVPLMAGIDVPLAVSVASRLSIGQKMAVRMVAPVLVARNLPLTAPMPLQEASAGALLDEADHVAGSLGLRASRHIERLRDLKEGLLELITQSSAKHVIIALKLENQDEDSALETSDLLLRRATCSVVIIRGPIE